ncbi:MAG: leucyl-tRNA--protein transferase [Nocardioidaceae bacterium]|nr:leucyl-tRNA--protein transferase [Nocardioidaceae bacterium]
MFHTATDASKVALMGLVEVLDDGVERLIDVQWRTDHLATLGVSTMTRKTYVEALPGLIRRPLPEIWWKNARNADE